MKVYLATAAVIGITAAALALPTPTHAANPSNGAGTTFNPSFGSSGNGSAKDTNPNAHMGTDNSANFGSSGSASSKDTGVQSHESSGSSTKQ